MKDGRTESEQATGDCPRQETLAEFLLGKLPDAVLNGIGRHVEGCACCQRLLDQLDDLEDSVVRDLRGASGDELGPSCPDLESQLREAEGLSRQVWQDQAKGGDSLDELPARLGQYELLERLGQGGMGTVYKALHTRLKRPVTLKVLPKDRMEDVQAVARFQREMEAVGRLDHPHLVRAFDAGEANGQPYLAMEFLEGLDLARLVRRSGPLSVANACEAVRQAALGLQHAHEHGLVHRDIKPSNLLLTAAGQVKVLDLGLARLTSDESLADDMTGSGQLLGTGDFIAPEQGQDPRQADARSDLYALGCTLYFLLAGEAPFGRAPYDTFLQKVLAHAQEPLPPIPSQRADLSADLVAILGKLTAKAPSERFQTAAEVAQALEAYTAGHSLQGTVPAGMLPWQEDEKPRRGKSLPEVGRLVVILAALLAGLLVVGLLFVGDRYGSRLAVVVHSLPDPVEQERLVAEINAEVARMSEDLRGEQARMQEDLESDLALPSEGRPPTVRLCEGLDRWLVVGPFLYASLDEAFEAVHPIERGPIDPNQCFETPMGTLHWKALEAKEAPTTIHVVEATGLSPPLGCTGVYYAACGAKAPNNPCRAGLGVVASGPTKLWINRTQVSKNSNKAGGQVVGRLAQGGGDGANEILLKLAVFGTRDALAEFRWRWLSSQDASEPFVAIQPPTDHIDPDKTTATWK